MTRKFTKLIIPAFILILGIQFTRDYFGDTTKTRKEELTELKNNGTKTLGTLNSSYEVRTIKILGVPTEFYNYTFTFFVQGKVFNGKFHSETPQSEMNQEVTYLESNPNINSLNVTEDLKSLIESEGVEFSLILGIILILLGGFLGFRVLKNNKATPVID